MNYSGEMFGKYHLRWIIGKGGFADVYEALDTELQRIVAIKVLHRSLTEISRQAFLREARAMAALNHEHILPIYDAFMYHDPPFIVMAYAPNGSLQERHLNGERLPMLLVLRYLQQIVAALSYIHRQGLVHRDIKPGNVLLDENDNLLISDFGIVAPARNTVARRNTRVVGTWRYMAPECFEGKRHPASDQYSVALMVYEWLVGESLISGDYSQINRLYQSEVPVHVRMKTEYLSLAVAKVLRKALAREPENRFVSIEAFAQAFEEASRILPMRRRRAARSALRQRQWKQVYMILLMSMLTASGSGFGLTLFYSLAPLALPGGVACLLLCSIFISLIKRNWLAISLSLLASSLAAITGLVLHSFFIFAFIFYFLLFISIYIGVILSTRKGPDSSTFSSFGGQLQRRSKKGQSR